MGRLLQNLLSQRYAGLLGIVVVVLVIYLVGVLAGVPWWWLHLAAVVTVVLAVGALVWQQRRASKAAGQLEAALKAQGQSHAAGARPDQRAGIEELKSAFDESLELLRGSKMGRGALYSIPWYILIGPPGSGKSTLLRESGLSFPYMTKGRSAIRGLGGTKNCDWWFADRGILLDTAGRYTTEAEDRDEWMAFLRMMKRGRGRRPINGAIVAIGLAEIVEATDAELSLYAENVRDRIDELTRELQLVFPIYLVFTKCDRLRGFVETFDTLTKEQRRQVWGFTFPFARQKGFDTAGEFGREFDELYKALCVRRVDLLASDHFKKRKAQVYAFPMQFLHLKERLQTFLSQVQQPNPYQEVSPVRGIYFTSGTQEGTTIDKILKVLRPAELELDVPQDARRCYFVDDVFNRVVFPDATLAAPTASSLRRDRQLRIGAGIAIAVLALVVLVWRWGAMSGFAAACADIEANIVKSDVDDPQVMRKALDAQLAMLDSGNHHLERGGVIDDLKRHYEATLTAYTNVRVAAAAADAVAAAKQAQTVAATQAAEQANRTLQQAYDRLLGIEAGVAGMANGDDAGRTAARTLWHDVVGRAPLDERHLTNLLAIDTPRVEVPVEAQVARSELTRRLAQDDQRDVRLAKELGDDELFAATHELMTRRRTHLRDLRGVSPQQWGAAALEASVPGPLLAGVSANAEALTLEVFFDEFRRDVERAKDRRGATSDLPLRRVADGGWVAHVERRRDEFVVTFGNQFAARWSMFLAELERVADAGEEAPAEDRAGVERLAVLPLLAAASAAADHVREVCARGEVLDTALAERLAGLAEQSAKRYSLDAQPDWARRPGTGMSGSLTGELAARAQAVAKHLEGERKRIAASRWSEAPGLEARLRELELALVEAIAAREWRSCAQRLQVLAEAATLPAWRRMVAGFPFAADAADEADAKELQAAIGGMNELAAQVRALQAVDAAAFALDPAFAAQLAAAEELCRMLYGGAEAQERPRVETTLLLQKGSAIRSATLTGSDDRVVSVPGPEREWPVGQQEALQLVIETAEGRHSFRDLVDARRRRVPDDWLFHGELTGVWALKRLCSIGAPQGARDGAEREFALTVRGVGSEVLLYVRTRRPEAATLFDADWPGERFQPVQRLWKQS